MTSTRKTDAKAKAPKSGKANNRDSKTMARAKSSNVHEAQAVSATNPSSQRNSTGPRRPTKQETCVVLLRANDGASIAELQSVTGWQAHSVRGFLAGTLKKRGLKLSSQKKEGIRRYMVTA